MKRTRERDIEERVMMRQGAFLLPSARGARRAAIVGALRAAAVASRAAPFARRGVSFARRGVVCAAWGGFIGAFCAVGWRG